MMTLSIQSVHEQSIVPYKTSDVMSVTAGIFVNQCVNRASNPYEKPLFWKSTTAFHWFRTELMHLALLYDKLAKTDAIIARIRQKNRATCHVEGQIWWTAITPLHFVESGQELGTMPHSRIDSMRWESTLHFIEAVLDFCNVPCGHDTLWDATNLPISLGALQNWESSFSELYLDEMRHPIPRSTTSVQKLKD